MNFRNIIFIHMLNKFLIKENVSFKLIFEVLFARNPLRIKKFCKIPRKMYCITKCLGCLFSQIFSVADVRLKILSLYVDFCFSFQNVLAFSFSLKSSYSYFIITFHLELLLSIAVKIWYTVSAYVYADVYTYIHMYRSTNFH